MRDFAKRYGVLSLIVLVVIFAAIADWATGRLEYQEHGTASQGQESSATKDNDFSVLFTIGAFADAHHDAIEAISAFVSTVFAVILTISTIGLWLEAERQRKEAAKIRAEDNAANQASLAVAQKYADAAMKSADVAERSMIDLEGPLLYPVIEQNNIRESFASFSIFDHPTSQHSPVRPEIIFRLKNYGRSPALPRTVSAVFFYGEPHQPPSDDFAALFGESFIVPGSASSKKIGRKTIKKIDSHVYRAIIANHGALYLKGSVVFFDIFGHQYEQTFCFRWIPVPGEDSFAAWGPQWNKRRRIINTSGNDY